MRAEALVKMLHQLCLDKYQRDRRISEPSTSTRTIHSFMRGFNLTRTRRRSLVNVWLRLHHTKPTDCYSMQKHNSLEYLREFSVLLRAQNNVNTGFWVFL